MVDTWAIKGFLYHDFRAHVGTITVLGPFVRQWPLRLWPIALHTSEVQVNPCLAILLILQHLVVILRDLERV